MQYEPNTEWGEDFRRAIGALRARQWAHFVALPLAGMDLRALGSRGGLTRVLVGAGAASLSLGFAYGLNAIVDRASDASAQKNPLAGARDVPAAVLVTVGGAAVAAAALGASLGRRAGFLTVVSLAAATLYSAGPRLKSIPVLGAMANTAIFAPLLGLCLPENGDAPPAFASLCTTFVGLLLQNQLLHEDADRDEDAEGGARTTARLLGGPATRIVAAALAVPFAVLSYRAAPSRRFGWMAATSLVAGAAISLTVRDPSAARQRHGLCSTALGGILFSVGLAS